MRSSTGCTGLQGICAQLMGDPSAKEGSSDKYELTCHFMLCFTEGLFVLHTKDLISGTIKIDTGHIVETGDSIDT